MERILLFLFVNNRCYPSQIQRLLSTPLTPIQKAFERLEKGGVVQSSYEGKTRIYEISPTYPLKSELEMLLKRAYTLLPATEKRSYCFIHKPRLPVHDERKRERNLRTELQTFWDRLKGVSQLTLFAKSQQGDQTTIHTGRGEVAVQETGQQLLFQEKGSWLMSHLPNAEFKNSFRWQLDLDKGLISLEYQRHGPSRPLFLFHLAPSRSRILESVDAHLCGSDTYLGYISWDESGIRFEWRIIGPQKNEELKYYYT